MCVTVWTHHNSNWQDRIAFWPFPPRSWIYEGKEKRLTQFRTRCIRDNLCDTKSINAHLTCKCMQPYVRDCVACGLAGLRTELAATTTTTTTTTAAAATTAEQVCGTRGEKSESKIASNDSLLMQHMNVQLIVPTAIPILIAMWYLSLGADLCAAIVYLD